MYQQPFQPQPFQPNQYQQMVSQAQQFMQAMRPPTYNTPQPEVQFVNGIGSAQAYQMGPNQRVILMDSEKARFYFKETDAAGVASIKAYDFTEAKDDEPQTVDYVTRAEFEEWKASHEPVVPQPQPQPEPRQPARVQQSARHTRPDVARIPEVDLP